MLVTSRVQASKLCIVFPGFCCCDVVVCGFGVGFVYLCGRCLRPCAFCGVGLWVVVLFENSIVCHLMKQTLFVYEHEHERGHQIVIVVGVCYLLLFCWFLCFLPVIVFCLFFWRV